MESLGYSIMIVQNKRNLMRTLRRAALASAEAWLVSAWGPAYSQCWSTRSSKLLYSKVVQEFSHFTSRLDTGFGLLAYRVSIRRLPQRHKLSELPRAGSQASESAHAVCLYVEEYSAQMSLETRYGKGEYSYISHRFYPSPGNNSAS